MVPISVLVDEIVTPRHNTGWSKNFNKFRLVNFQNLIHFSLSWHRFMLFIKVMDYCIKKLARFKQRNTKVRLVSSMDGSTCYSLVLSLRMFLWLYEKYKHTSFFCIISFRIEKCSGLDLLFRREILKKNIRILPLYLRGSCLLFWVMSAF